MDLNGLTITPEQERRWKQWRLTEDEQEEFLKMFVQVDFDHDGYVNGDQAKQLFGSSGIPMDVLGKIWSLSDRDKDKRLDAREYCIAMFLIRQKQKGELIPSSLPENFITSVYPEVIAPSTKTQQYPTFPPGSNIPVKGSPAQLRASTPKPIIQPPPSILHQPYPPQSPPKTAPIAPNQFRKVSDAHPPSQGPPRPMIPGSPPAYNDPSRSYKTIPELVEEHRSSVPPLNTQDVQAQLQRMAEEENKLDKPENSPYAVAIPNNKPANRKSLPTVNNGPNSMMSTSSPNLRVSGNDAPNPSHYASPIMAKSEPPKSRSEQNASNSPTPNGGWVKYSTPDGKFYFHNKVTGVTQWNKPAEFQETPISSPKPVHKVDMTASNKSQSAPRGSVNVTEAQEDDEDESVNETDDSGSTLGTAELVSAEELLQDPQKRDFLKKYLDSMEDSSELLFYIDTENFRKNIKGPTVSFSDIQTADAIYNKYIRRKSRFKINVSSAIVKKLTKIFNKKDKSKIDFAPDVFEEARESIIKNLEKEQLPKFLKSMFYIAMFNSYSNNKEYELPQQVFSEFLIAAEGGGEDGWQYVMEKSGVLVHKKNFKNNPWICVRGSCVIPLPLDEMHRFVTSIRLRKYWDFKCNGKVIQKYDEKTCVALYDYPPPKWAPMYNHQEYVIIRTEKTLPDGTRIFLSRSVIHPDAPERKGYTRSEVEVSGFVLRAVGTNATVVIYVSQAAMKGVPKWAESMLCNKRAMLPNKIRKYVEKELKDKKKIPAWKDDNLW